MKHEVGFADLLQRRPERLDELVRQMADKADRVGQRVVPPVRRLGAAHSRVERREQCVLDEHPCAGEPVEQGGLSGVGVARDDHARHGPTTALLPLHLAGCFHAGDLAAQLRAALADPAPVGLDLRLTGTTGADTATTGDTTTSLAR